MLGIRVLGVVLFLLCSLVSPVYSVCTTPRLRKSYDRLTLEERSLYRQALQLSMDKGYYIKFVEMHTDKMSEMEAHRVCMFTYWHRYFLLGFENMLRSLGPQFECITIPYWDEIQQNARFTTGACKTFEDCAPIVRDMGGSTVGPVKGISINGQWVSGTRCVDRAPMNHFCESSSKTGAACAKCLPRGDLAGTSFPGSTNFASVYRQLFTSGGFISTANSIENGMHNAMHNSLGGAMGTFQSPSDPLFWSHHANVDLLLTIYLKCRVGFGKLNDTQKMNNPYAFVQCPHREDAGLFTATSTITMRNGELGIIPKQVSQPGQVLYPFFKDLPNKYYQLSDVTALGASSRYMYQVGGLVGQMATQCDASKGSRRLDEEGSGEMSTTSTEPVQPESHHECKTDVDDPPSDDRSLPDTKVPKVFQVVSEVAQDKDASKVDAWTQVVRQELRAINYTAKPNHTEEISQMEKMVCMFYDKCRGGVQDYTEEFKKAFKVTEPPPCKRIVDELNRKTSKRPIKLAKWKKTMERFFPCDVPTPTTPEPSASSTYPTSTPEPSITSTYPTLTPEPSITSTEPAQSTSTPEPSMTSTNSPQSTATPEPGMTSTETPQSTATPEPSVGSTNSPQSTSKPEPSMTSTSPPQLV